MTRVLSALAVVALLAGCPPTRPDPSVSASGPCAQGETQVCFGACASTSTAGQSCSVNECAAPPLAVCGRDLSCVPTAPGATTGQCQPASIVCNPDAPSGAADNRCPGTMVCRRLGNAAQVSSGAACGVNVQNVFRNPDGSPARGVCAVPRRDGDPCNSTWEEARASNGTAGDPSHPLCNPCAPGLQCLRGTCRRPCPNGRNDCPGNLRGNVEQSYDYACSVTNGTNLCTTCAPLGGLCPPTAGLSDAPGGVCCTPSAICQRTCCLPEQAQCTQSSDCCAGTLCRDNNCVPCGGLHRTCCDDLHDETSHPRCGAATLACAGTGLCEPCGTAGIQSCNGTCTGRSVVPAGSTTGPCVACGALGNPICRGGTPCDGVLVSWGGTCRACGGNGMPPCSDGNCQGEMHLNWNAAAGANLCDPSCGQPMTREHPFPSYACAERYPVLDTFQYRYRCFHFTQISSDGLAGRWHCLCVPSMASPPMENDVSDDSGTCTSTHPNPDERPGPPDDG